MIMRSIWKQIQLFGLRMRKNDIWCTVVSKKGEFSSYEKTSSNFSLWALRWKYCLPRIFSHMLTLNRSERNQLGKSMGLLNLNLKWLRLWAPYVKKIETQMRNSNLRKKMNWITVNLSKAQNIDSEEKKILYRLTKSNFCFCERNFKKQFCNP